MAVDNNHHTLNFAQKCCVGVLWGLCRLVALTPRVIRYYVIEELIYFVMHHLIRYRRGVVMTNLRNSFPEKSRRELSSIARRYDRFLAEQIINTLSVTGIGRKRQMRYMTFPGAADYAAATAGQDVVLVSGHYGCWEYFTAVALYDEGHRLMSIYHPLENSVLDELFLRIRRCDNSVLVPRDEAIRYYIRHRHDGRNLAIGLIADQNPFRRKDAYWLTFLNQESIFADGAEQLSVKFGMPMYFAYMKRLVRGRYEMYMEQLYDGKQPVADHELTVRYAQALERVIRECPELWLWSHRRWKQIRNPEECLH